MNDDDDDDDDNNGNAGIPFIPNNHTVTHHHSTTDIFILICRNYFRRTHSFESPSIAATTHLYGSFCAVDRIQSHDERMYAEKTGFIGGQ